MTSPRSEIRGRRLRFRCRMLQFSLNSMQNAVIFFELNAECIISGKSTNDLTLNCGECCNSEFFVVDGSVIEGPANQALQKYTTYFDGEMLYITN